MKRIIYTAIYALIMFHLPISTADAEIIILSSHDPEFCKIVLRHTPSDDVSFEPGKDNVVPADISPAITEIKTMDNDIVIPITLDLIKHFELEDTFTESDATELKPEISQFRIKSDGRVFWNDKDITEQTEHFCQNPPE